MVSLVAQMNRRIKARSLVLAGVLWISPVLWAQTSPCDLNKDGVVNATDVTLAVNMALGMATCTATLEGASSTCTVITVQRVVNASQGQTCLTYNTHGVTLNWGASTSQNVAGYNIYRGTTTGGPYTKLNTTGLITVLTYSDSAVSAGLTYFYVATTVDVSGNESAYSTQTTATIPTP
jgi:hypothetical protein